MNKNLDVEIGELQKTVETIKKKVFVRLSDPQPSNALTHFFFFFFFFF